MRKSRIAITVVALLFVAVAQIFAGTPATMTSPTNGTKFTGSSQTFMWGGGSGVTSYTLYVGTTKGAHDIANVSAGTTTSSLVSGLPTNGETLYVTLYSLIGATQTPEYYTYYASGTGTAATITIPANKTTLSGASVTFNWGGGLGIGEYVLWIGSTANAHDIDNVTLASSATSYTATNLPTNGETVYVTLNSQNGNTFLKNSYTYTASGHGTAAAISSPANNSTLTGANVTFNWSGGTGIDEYVVWIGSTSGGHDIDNVVLGPTASSTSVTNLPTNGEKVYVTLNSLNGSTWLKNTYTYVAHGTGTAASITSPTNGSVFSGTSATFHWSGGVGIDEYVLYVGTTAGGHNLDNIVLPATATSTSITNLPTNGAPIYVTLNSLNGNTWLKTTDTYTESGTPLAFQDSEVNQALISTPYANQIFINGGSGGPYTVSLSSGSLPAGLSIVNGNPAIITGTPTTAGTSTFVLKATDSASDTATSASLKLTVSPAPDGKHNAYLNGQYTCKFQGFLDSDNSQWGFIASVVLNGSGLVKSGYYDSNGRTTGYNSGTLTGTYNLGSNNNGVLSISTGGGTYHYLIMANKLAGPAATVIGIVESDDVGSSPSGQHGAGACYLSTPSDFVAASVNGHGFVVSTRGENGSGIPKAFIGTYQSTAGTSSGGTVSSGVADTVKGTSVQNDTTFGGSYSFPTTAPSFTSLGRYTGTYIATGQSTGPNYAIYVINQGSQFLIRTDASTGLDIGKIVTQQKASFSAANFTGAFLMNWTFDEVDSTNTVQRWMAELMEGTANGAGGGTINQSYSLEDTVSGSQDYRVGDSNGAFSGVSVAANGRVTGLGGTTIYLTNTNVGQIINYGTNGAGYTSVGLGDLEPQFSTSGLTDSTVTGSYLITTSPQLNPSSSSQANLLTLTYPGSGTSDNATVLQDNAGYADFGYASPLSATYSFSSTTFGTANISQSGQVIVNCIVINATNEWCIQTNTGAPRILYVQQ